jgi:1-deoxy-D-xylulose-5-phosphate reductoisomerase
VTPDEACAHPNWVMGRKISVDSATMMNKALEVIEARWLFDLAPEQIKVVIHPQSIIHSMVVCRDAVGAGAAGHARHARAHRLWPVLAGAHRVRAPRLDFLLQVAALTFEAPDLRRFPALRWPGTPCGARGSTAVLNAANEVAVAAFLGGQLRFTETSASRACSAPIPARCSLAAVPHR